ncbi:hypothetical protein MP228_000003 [Amoeboaphelidium protococcarum]|nr:hypothetical protein MP228_000003 [Amoeboaphelidium protococcarum]
MDFNHQLQQYILHKQLQDQQQHQQSLGNGMAPSSFMSTGYGGHNGYYNSLLPPPQLNLTPQIALTSAEREQRLAQYKAAFEERKKRVLEEHEQETELKKQKTLHSLMLELQKSSLPDVDIEQEVKRCWSDICKQVPQASSIRLASRVGRVKCSQILAQNALTIYNNTLAIGTKQKTQISSKEQKERAAKVKKVSKDVAQYWKQNEKIEKERLKRAEKEKLERLKVEEEEMEKKRQAKKLQFLINQTELYSHFVKNKGQNEVQSPSQSQPQRNIQAAGGSFDQMTEQDLYQLASQQAQSAVNKQLAKVSQFDDDDDDNDSSQGGSKRRDSQKGGANQQLKLDIKQPELFQMKLKPYQLKGLQWLCSLYEQGINGILADDMGLGKTAQTIALVSWLAEVKNIWGPFLVVVPASTLHNWYQEFNKFAPALKLLPYWGSSKDRQILRKFWTTKKFQFNRDSEYHVLITSYQIVVQDQPYFQRQKWKYLILDEAHAIKSSGTTRWKTLLKLNCRNRLLLTGTPIQNNMQELWALLHFIMPTLFDSHEEFASWFSKDIESHAVSKGSSKLDQVQVDRLHMILKPFMLRRTKKEVESELGDKIEKTVYCDMTFKQKKMYSYLSEDVEMDNLLQKLQLKNDDDQEQSDKLMNAFVQLRKVVNHVQLFDIASVKSSIAFSSSLTSSGNDMSEYLSDADHSNPIEYRLPKLILEDQIEYRGSNYTEPRAECLKLFNKFFGLNLLDGQDLEDLDLYMQNVAKLKSLKLQRSKVDLSLRFESSLHNPYIAQELSPLEELLNVRQRLFVDEFRHFNAHVIDKVTTKAPLLHASSSRLAIHQQNLCIQPNLIKQVFERKSQSYLYQKFYGADCFSPPLTLNGFSQIDIPDFKKILFDSGKIQAIHGLLKELKNGGHKVLIYFQMTRMMDLFEEYLAQTKYRYLRLDGSTKISDRRDMVSQFQQDPEIFIFILSTRAGGLGINLTAADTIIFFEHDWNPTNDQQAMDRSHRLGQTRQVTVYRLITRGTVEEHILNRALQKSEIQKVVMQQ